MELLLITDMPILVDVGKDLNIDCDKIEKNNKNTKAIMPVHLSGIPSDIENKKFVKGKIFIL